MAFRRLPHQLYDGSTSIFLPTVSLYGWWLIRPENESDGKMVGVAGFTSPKDGLVKRPARVFKSAPITKVYDLFTLETADNVTVLLNGFINDILTAENGFSSEVCKNFVMGFPAHWEKLVAEEGNSSATIKTSADIESQVPNPVSRSKKDQKSPRRQKNEKDQKSPRRKKSKKENQPKIESQVPNPVSRSKKDRTSPGKENQPSTRTKRNLFTEYIAGDLSSDLPEDAMEEVRVDPSSASPLVKHKSVKNASQTGEEPSSAPPLVQPRQPSRRQIEKGDVRRQTTTPVATPQTKKSPRRQKSEKNQKSPRRQKSKTENQPRDDIEVSREEPSSSPPPLQSKISSHHHIGKHKSVKNVSQMGEEPSCAPPLVKSRRPSHRQIGKGDVRRQTTTPVATPQTKGMVSPDSFKRSRSGRILLPPLAFWRNELPVYDENRNIAGVQGLDMAVDSKDTGNMSRRK